MAVQNTELKFVWALNTQTIEVSKVLNKSDEDIFAPEDAALLKSLKLQVLEKGIGLHKQLWLTSNEKRVFVDLYLEPLRNEKKEVTGIGIVSLDLTTQKLTEKAFEEARETLARNERIMSYFLDSVPVGVIKWGIDGTIFEVNERFLEITGYSNEDILEKPLSWLNISSEYTQRDKEATKEYLSTGKCYPYEKVITGKKGNIIPVVISSVMVDPESRMGIAFLIDVTEIKKKEESLRISEE
jgi:PAS domain S-box-containing protein